MIVTVTLNPSLDRAIEIDHLARGDVLRARSGRLDPGGKGVNVSRALLNNGVASRAVLPCGGDAGAQLVRLLAAEGVDLIAVPIGGHTRSNITLAEPDGTVTKVNEPGPSLSTAEFDAVTGQALAAAGSAGWVVVCGSLPPGVTPAAFGGLCRRIVAAGVRLAVDTSGPALRAAAEAGAHLVKPNREELSEVVGHPLTSRSDVISAADRVRTWGAGAVLASLGADGAILVTADTVVSGAAEVFAPRSSVGAGDALLAGFLAALTRSADPNGRPGGVDNAAASKRTGDTPEGGTRAAAGLSAATGRNPTEMPADRVAGETDEFVAGATAATVNAEGMHESAADADHAANRGADHTATADADHATALGTDHAAAPDANHAATRVAGHAATPDTNRAASSNAGHATPDTNRTATPDTNHGASSAAGHAATPDAGRAAAAGSGRRSVLVAALAEGLAWGAAAVSLPGSRMPRPEDLRRDAVVIHPDSDLVRSPGSAGRPDPSPAPEGSVR